MPELRGEPVSWRYDPTTQGLELAQNRAGVRLVLRLSRAEVFLLVRYLQSQGLDRDPFEEGAH